MSGRRPHEGDTRMNTHTPTAATHRRAALGLAVLLALAGCGSARAATLDATSQLNDPTIATEQAPSTAAALPAGTVRVAAGNPDTRPTAPADPRLAGTNWQITVVGATQITKTSGSNGTAQVAAPGAKLLYVSLAGSGWGAVHTGMGSQAPDGPAPSWTIRFDDGSSVPLPAELDPWRRAQIDVVIAYPATATKVELVGDGGVQAAFDLLAGTRTAGPEPTHPVD